MPRIDPIWCFLLPQAPHLSVSTSGVEEVGRYLTYTLLFLLAIHAQLHMDSVVSLGTSYLLYLYIQSSTSCKAASIQ